MFIQKIKTHVRGIIGWAVIIGIAIPFAMFGVSPYVGSTITPTDLLVVGDRGFSRDDIAREVQIQRNKIIKMFGQDRLPDNFDDDRVFRMAINEMVANELANQYSTDRSMMVGSQELLDYIYSQPDLQNDDGFDKQKLYDLALEQGLNLSQFENRYRESIVRKQLETAMGQSYLMPDTGVELHNLINAHKRDVSIFSLPENHFIELAEISDEQVAEHHENHANDFMAPEKISIDYILLDRERVIEGIEVSESDLRAAFEQRSQVTSEEEKRLAKHILIATEDNASDEDIDQAYDKITQLQTQLQEGASFADLAREHSDDPGSAAQGGDLGEVSRGVMVKPFEEALFALEEGQVSGVVTTQFGLHLILLEEIINDEPATFEDVSDELKTQVAEEKSFQLYDEKLVILRDLAVQHPDGLDKIAESMSIEIASTEVADRGSLPEPFSGFDDQLFIPELIESAGEKLSQVLELSDSQAAIARVREHTPETQRPLEEVREDIITRLKEDFARQQRADLRTKLETKLAVSNSFAQLQDIEFAPLERQNLTGISRDDAEDLSRDEIDAVFSLRYPGASIGLEVADDAEINSATTDHSLATTAEVADDQLEEDNADAIEELSDSDADQAAASQKLDAAAETSSSAVESTESSEDAISVEQTEPKDYAYTILGDEGLKLIVLHAIASADAENLEQSQDNARSRVKGINASVSINAFYKYLQEYSLIDLSGLQAPSTN